MDQIATLQQQLSKSTPARETIAPASTAEESGGLKEMLEQALTKMSKLEKDLEAAKKKTQTVVVKVHLKMKIPMSLWWL